MPAPSTGLARVTISSPQRRVDVALPDGVPLAELLQDGVFREERWEIFGEERAVFFFELVGDTVWGATARILYQLLALLTVGDVATDAL